MSTSYISWETQKSTPQVRCFPDTNSHDQKDTPAPTQSMTPSPTRSHTGATATARVRNQLTAGLFFHETPFKAVLALLLLSTFCYTNFLV